MAFSDKQNDELSAHLSRDNVKTRDQGGKKLSYIEGWVVIKEANRIFGFDGWNRETILLQETNRILVDLDGNRGPYQQWRIGYIAKVRITVGHTVREGTGYGSGMGKPEAIGDAVEGAIKEAETDAMKRCLMTFGNPFGLALYDKEQNEVEDAPSKPLPKPQQKQTGPQDIEPMPAPIPTTTPAEWATKAIARVKGFTTRKELDDFEEKYHLKISKIRPVEPDLHEKLMAAIRTKHTMFAA